MVVHQCVSPSVYVTVKLVNITENLHDICNAEETPASNGMFTTNKTLLN